VYDPNLSHDSSIRIPNFIGAREPNQFLGFLIWFSVLSLTQRINGNRPGFLPEKMEKQ
jgi:hypothetical protein